jgi:hypothetical protein
MVKDRCVDSTAEYEWQRVARRKQTDREMALAKFADWRVTIQPEGMSDVSQLPLENLTDRERIIVRCDATALADLVRKRLHTSVEVLIAYAKAAVVAQDATNCLTEIFIEEALDRARELDQHLEDTGNVVGPLHGQLNSAFASTIIGCLTTGMQVSPFLSRTISRSKDWILPLDMLVRALIVDAYFQLTTRHIHQDGPIRPMPTKMPS